MISPSLPSQTQSQYVYSLSESYLYLHRVSFHSITSLKFYICVLKNLVVLGKISSPLCPTLYYSFFLEIPFYKAPSRDQFFLSLPQLSVRPSLCFPGGLVATHPNSQDCYVHPFGFPYGNCCIISYVTDAPKQQQQLVPNQAPSRTRPKLRSR